MITVRERLALALDPVQLMRRAGLTPDPWQADFLRCTDQRVQVLASRQVGKSTVTAVKGVHTAIFHPGSVTLLISPSLRQSGELFRRSMAIYQDSGSLVPVENVSSLRVELANGSRILSLPGKAETVRGFTADLVIIDEGAQVGDDLYRSLTPSLAVTGGKLIAISTPFGRRGWFFEEFDAGSHWRRFKVTADDCPRIDPAFLKTERAALGERWFQQEYYCEFRDTIDAYFSYESIMAAVDDTIPPLFSKG